MTVAKIGLQVSYSTADLRVLMPELSRFQIYRLKKQCGAGRRLYVNQIRKHAPDVWESLALCEFVGNGAKSRRARDDDES